MTIYEVIIDPELRDADTPRPYRYTAIAAWENEAAKHRNEGIERAVRAKVVRAQLFADFKCFYDPIGIRIVSRNGPTGLEYQTVGGVWIPEQSAGTVPPNVPFVWQRETFSRDLDREIAECHERYMLRASSNQYRGDRRGTTINKQVAAGADDAFEQADGGGFSSSSFFHSNHANTTASQRFNVGWRFTDITIAAGSTIDACVLQVNVGSTGSDDPNVTLSFNDVDNAANFSTEADVTSRVITTATTDWVAIGLLTGFKTSPSIAAALQEVIDRAGWASGNAVVALSKGKSDINRSFAHTPYESSSANAAKLDIDYTAAAGAGNRRRRQLICGVAA
jgi:hypothetical protein